MVNVNKNLSEVKEAIILAGGFGTRLQHIVNDVPKPMAPINGKPFLSYLFDHLIKFNFNHIVLSTGYLHEKIESFYKNKYQNISISYAHEDYPLGTGGAIRFALSKCKTDEALILNGDTLFCVDIDDFISFSKSKKSNLSIVLREVEDVSRYGSVQFDSNMKINLFTEKSKVSGKGFVNGGIYWINKKLFDDIQLPEKFSFEKDLMEKFCLTDNFFAYQSDSYFIDIGIPDDYAKAQIEFKILAKVSFCFRQQQHK